MAELALNLDMFNKIDDKTKKEFLENAEKAGLTPTQFLKSLIQDFIGEKEERLNEEVRKSIIEGRADFDAGRLKKYNNAEEMMKDILEIVGKK